MATDISANPWHFDSTSVGFSYYGPVYIGEANIYRVVSSGDQIQITDWNGKDVINFIADENNDSYRSGRLSNVWGLKIAKFDSGEALLTMTK